MKQDVTRGVTTKVLNINVIVAALGYFVDIFDLQLFNLVSKSSLKGIGITDPELLNKYDYTLFLYQMAGMLVGGLCWGILGDKKGRKSILFGSILLYSIANIANAYVTSIPQYACVRFFAGLGLAGELGAAITLVSETMHRLHRGWGTMVIVALGALGAVAANIIARNCSWQMTYIIGGGLGLALLLLRMGTYESGMFQDVKSSQVSKGNFLQLFSSRATFFKYLWCILLGLPVWFILAVPIKFCDHFSQQTHVVGGAVLVRDAIMYVYIGLSVGDLLSGAWSQWWQSRRKVVAVYLLACTFLLGIFLFVHGIPVFWYYVLCFLLGAATGYWALFVSIASEQFGTNIRATVTTTVPNFVRGAVIPITLGYKYLEHAHGAIVSATIIGTICMVLAFLSIYFLQETFGKDLDYLEVS